MATIVVLVVTGVVPANAHAQQFLGFQIVADSWGSPESGTNLGAGLRIGTRPWGESVLIDFTGNFLPFAIGLEEGLDRQKFFDFDVGILYTPESMPLYVGAGWGNVLAINGLGMGPIDGSANVLRAGVWPFMGDTFVEVQYWHGTRETTLTGAGERDRWVVMLGGLGDLR